MTVAGYENCNEPTPPRWTVRAWPETDAGREIRTVRFVPSRNELVVTPTTSIVSRGTSSSTIVSAFWTAAKPSAAAERATARSPSTAALSATLA